MSVREGIYVPFGLDGFALCQPVDASDFERINVESAGQRHLSGWSPIDMRLIEVDEGRQLWNSDAPWLGPQALIFGSRAVEQLGEVLQKHGELLPLLCPGANLELYNATRIVDALDEEASSLKRFGSGRIIMVTEYVFKPEKVAEEDVFKIPNLRVCPTFLSHRFVALWERFALRGLGFKLVWSAP
jgi:hypothetical protein